jgi:hypothetical protein
MRLGGGGLKASQRLGKIRNAATSMIRKGQRVAPLAPRRRNAAATPDYSESGTFPTPLPLVTRVWWKRDTATSNADMRSCAADAA